MFKSKLLRLFIGLLISVFFLWLVIKDIELERVVDSLGQFNFPLLLFGLVVWLGGYLVRGWRWQYFLNHIKPVSFATSFKVLVIGFTGNNLLPLRAGEVIRAYFLGRAGGISKSSALATISAERIFDGLVIVVLMLVGATSLTMPTWARNAILGASALFATAFTVFVLMILREEWFGRVLRFVLRFLPREASQKVENILSHFIHGLKFLHDGSALVKIVALSFAIWLIESTFYYIAAIAFGFPLGFLNALFLKGVINLAVLLPSSPGYIGTFEYFAVQTLTLFGVGNEAALAYALIVHLAQHVPISVMGIWFASQMGGSLFSAGEVDKSALP